MVVIDAMLCYAFYFDEFRRIRILTTSIEYQAESTKRYKTIADF